MRVAVAVAPVTAPGGLFVLHAKALPAVLMTATRCGRHRPDIEVSGYAIARAYVDKEFRNHDM